MWKSRWLFARASRNPVFLNGNASSASRIPLSNPNLSNPSSPSSFSSLFLPHFSFLSKIPNPNPRFFSHPSNHLSTDSSVAVTPTDADANSPFENDASQIDDEPVATVTVSDAHEEVVENEEAEEEEVYEIDEEQLENVLRLLQSSADGSLESSLDDIGLTLHEAFVIKIIETPSVLSENLIRFIKWACNEKSFKVTTPVVESLVSTICSGTSLRRKQIYSVWDLVKDIGEKENGVLNVQILNQVIISLSKLGKGKAALEVFDKFEEVFQCVPNADTYYFTIEALCRRSFFDWAWSVSQKMLDAQSLPDGHKVGDIISWFCKGNKAKEAYAVYMAAKEKRKQPPVSCVKFLVAKLCQENETVKLALEILNDLPSGEERKHAIKVFSDVVRALCRIKDVDAAKQLVLRMIAEGLPPGNAVFNFVITGYCKVGEMGQALEMVKLLESRGLKPDVYTYTVLMSGYSNAGEVEEARKILAEAKKKHSKLSPVMYHTLIRGYCKLEQFDEALKLLTEMKDFGVRPNVDEYEKLIQSLCLKALDWEAAEKLQEEMKENGFHLKGITRALVRAVKEMEKEVVDADVISSAS